ATSNIKCKRLRMNDKAVDRMSRATQWATPSPPGAAGGAQGIQRGRACRGRSQRFEKASRGSNELARDDARAWHRLTGTQWGVRFRVTARELFRPSQPYSCEGEAEKGEDGGLRNVGYRYAADF